MQSVELSMLPFPLHVTIIIYFTDLPRNLLLSLPKEHKVGNNPDSSTKGQGRLPQPPTLSACSYLGPPEIHSQHHQQGLRSGSPVQRSYLPSCLVHRKHCVGSTQLAQMNETSLCGWKLVNILEPLDTVVLTLHSTPYSGCFQPQRFGQVHLWSSTRCKWEGEMFLIRRVSIVFRIQVPWESEKSAMPCSSERHTSRVVSQILHLGWVPCIFTAP